MRKSIRYEILAATAAMIGVVLFVFTYYPIINPIQYGLDNDRESAPLGRYLLGTPISILILSGAWYFNRKTQKLKRDERNSKHAQKPSDS
jgi:hypothetical protein